MNNKHNHITPLLAALMIASAANAREIQNLKAGHLSEAGIEPTETTLKISGTMNAADFFYIFDNLNALQSLDLGNVTIEAYSGPSLAYTGISSSPANTLPDYSLTGLTALRSIVLPQNLDAIGRGALSGTGLTRLTVPSGVTAIDDYALMRCPALVSVEIPQSVTRLGTRAFAYCPSLTTVSLEASVAEIPEGLFEACGGLRELDLAALSRCTDIGPWALAECNGVETLVLPENSEAISKASLYGTSGISTLILPSTVSYIGQNAMSAMSALSVLNASQVGMIPDLGENVWSRMDQSKVTLVTPTYQADDYRNAAQWQEFDIVPLNEWQQSSTNNVASAVGAEKMTLKVVGDQLVVSTENGTLDHVAVFSISGVQVASAQGKAEARFSIAGWPRGAYLVISKLGAAKITL